MRQLSVNRLKQGDVLGRTIYSQEGRVLLGRGVILSTLYINRLRDLGISILYIDDEETKDIVIEDVVSEEHRREAMIAVEKVGEAARSGKDIEYSKVGKIVNNIIDDILFQDEIIVSLSDMRSFDNQIFAHSVNVCILATIIGKALNYTSKDLETLAVGALLHDIGTVRLPKTLLNKRTPFTPQEMVLYENHAEEGFEILRSKREISLISAHIAFQHHERINGSGFPRNLSGDRIHPMAQIVGLVDFYDNLVNDGPGHLRILPHEACEVLMGSADKLFPHNLVITFLKHIAVYPTGCTVKLNTGATGIIVKQNKSLPTRPIVRVLTGDSDITRVQAKEYNLVEARTTFIDSIYE